MAIIFGNINNGAGGGAGNLWAFNTVAPTSEIELNNAAGATGIRARLPANNNLEITFREVIPGFFIGGFGVYGTPTKIMFAGAQDNPSGKSATIAAQDTVTGAIAIQYANFDSLGRPSTGAFLNDAGSYTLDEIYEAAAYLRRIEDAATSDKIEVQQTESAHEVNAFSSGVEKFRVRVTPGGLKLFINAGANLAFGIDENGLIFTNQSEAPTATDTTILNRIPIYDEVGVLVGYIPLMVDP